MRIDDVVDAYRRELAVRRGLSARTVAAYAAEARSLLAFLADLAGQDASEPIDVAHLGLGKSIKCGELSFEGLELVTPKEVVVVTVKMTRAAMGAAAAAAK